MSLTNPAEQAALEAVLTGTYIALFTDPPLEDGTGGTEVAGDGYVRKSWTPSVTQGDPTVATNTVTLAWSATSNWGIISHACVMDAAVGGTVIAVNELVDPNNTSTPLPKEVNSGDDIQFSIGTFDVTME